jgi:predicted transcriptional regulator of viral defense system
MEVSCKKSMNQKLYKILVAWPKTYITDIDLSMIIDRSDASRYGLVNRAIKQGILIHIRKGLYVISLPERRGKVDVLELGQMIYGPSFISLESALEYHRMIPERVYEVTSVTTNRSVEFSTPIGLFSYKKIPKTNFLLGVERIEKNSTCYFMAHPWRAIADLIYIGHRDWSGLNNLCEDLRIDKNHLLAEKMGLLVDLIDKYPSKRTQQILKKLKEKI